MSAVLEQARPSPAPRAWHSVAAAVAAKEWMELRRNPRGRLLAWVVAALMLVALIGGAVQYEHNHDERHAAQGADHALWSGQGDKDPHGAAHFGQWAFKPPSLLALADPGIDAYSGGAVWMEAHKRNAAQFRPARDSGVAARLGGLNLAFMLQVVLPLVVIVLGFDAVSGERENGTLRQLLAHGTTPGALVLGKGLALMRGLAWLLLPLLLALAGVGAVLAEPGQAMDAVQRALAWTAGHALYLAGFVALTLAVSAAAPSSRGALVSLLALWLLATFFAPRLMTEWARSAVELPSTQEFRQRVAAERSKNFGHDETHPAFAAFKAEVLEKYGVERVEDLPVNMRGLALRRDDELTYAIYDRAFGELDDRFDRQDQVRETPGAVLPLLAMQPLSMALAGTDRAHHRHFMAAAEAHRRVIQTATSDDLIHNQRYGDTSYVAPASLWARMPAFSYQPPSPAWALSQAALPLALLGGWLLFTLGLATFTARRVRAVA